MRYDELKGKYILLQDGTIVKAIMWSDMRTEIFNEDKTSSYPNYPPSEQEVYFKYRLIDRIRTKRKSAFVRESYILSADNSVRVLKRRYKEYLKHKLK